ncbi:hypothetical protein F4679DRAFT_533873 [Xylaria curta]|nr:hypothetical protein F4679DRAFT_533873 [Xylaria curta]
MMRSDLACEPILLCLKYTTRLLRVDLGSRSCADPFQDWIHKWHRGFRYWRLIKKSQGRGTRSR